jgi:hypothetical protein
MPLMISRIGPGARPARRQTTYFVAFEILLRAHDNSFSSAFASFRSSVSNPSEPAIDRSSRSRGLIALALIVPETRHTHCGAQLT